MNSHWPSTHTSPYYMLLLTCSMTYSSSNLTCKWCMNSLLPPSLGLVIRKLLHPDNVLMVCTSMMSSVSHMYCTVLCLSSYVKMASACSSCGCRLYRAMLGMPACSCLPLQSLTSLLRRLPWASLFPPPLPPPPPPPLPSSSAHPP